MSQPATVELQSLLDRLREGDKAARRQFLELACGRLRRLAARILYGSFPSLQARHDVDSVVHETWLRLIQALDKADPPTVEDFFRLAAHKIRQVLLDMADRRRRIEQRETLLGTGSMRLTAAGESASGQTYDAAKLALWTEFHNRVGQLPDAQRSVFEMHYYLGLPQSEIARLLALHPRKVSYLWIAATEELAEVLSLTEGLT
ncbi:MAG: sigma-70 family RNA polymerase sigma factor [Planctomycetaceae bacterium]|nr:sigma-70 family RNA polymerase sigma factor [Planctomycetaceae bacterium]